MNRRYTILLLLPDYLREGAEARDDTYLAYAYGDTVEDAADLARKEAAVAIQGSVEDAENFAVLFVCAGYQEDLYDGRA